MMVRVPLIAALALIGSPTLIASGEAVVGGAHPTGGEVARDYATACGTCHDNGGFAVRVLSDRLGPDRALITGRRDLTPAAIRAIVRNGFGAMPAMSKLEVSDQELEAIIAELGKARAGGASG